MYAQNLANNIGGKESGVLARGGPALAVIGIHVLIIYGLATSMGIVKIPKFAAPIEAVFIPEQTQVEHPARADQHRQSRRVKRQDRRVRPHGRRFPQPHRQRRRFELGEYDGS